MQNFLISANPFVRRVGMGAVSKESEESVALMPGRVRPATPGLPRRPRGKRSLPHCRAG